MNRGIQILLLDESQGSRAGLRAMLAGADVSIVGEAIPGPEGFNLARDLKPDIVLLNMEEPLVRALKTLEALVTNFPEIPVIAVSSLASREHMRKAMLAGARDYLTKPLNRSELVEALENVVRAEEKRILFRQARVSAAPEQGSVVSVFGPKGGVGKSTVAVNLAIAMAKARQRVCLVDLDIEEGADALLLDLSPRKSLLDVPAGSGPIDPELLKGFMTEHASGLHLLAAPLDLNTAESKGASVDMPRLIEALTSIYEYVVFDTPPKVNDQVRMLLQASTYILVLTSLELTSIHLVKKYLDTMRYWEFARDKIKIVTNVANCSNSVKKNDIEDFLGLPVFWTIPNDPKIGEANQHGQPVVEMSPHSKAAEAISGLHYTLTGLTPRAQGVGGLFKLGRK